MCYIFIHILRLEIPTCPSKENTQKNGIFMIENDSSMKEQITETIAT